MNKTRFKINVLVLLPTLLAGQVLPSPTQEAGRAAAGGEAVALDLSKNLSPRESEMRLVVQRYQADRDKLSAFYTIGGGRGGGRGGAGGGGGGRGETLSAPSRFGRMKRFYVDWEAAVKKIDTAKLAAGATEDKQKLLEEIQRDVTQLESQYRAQSEVAPAIPFAGTIMGLEDGRRRMEKPDAEKAAIQVASLPGQIAVARKAMEAGNIRVSKAVERRAADTVNSLRTGLRNWNNFYYDYDPLFTWWMAQPYKDADKALGDYSEFLRGRAGDGVEETTNGGPAPKAPEPVNLAAAPAGKPSDVPDLNELLAFPQSEMRGVIQRYQTEIGGGGRGGGGRRGGGGAAAAGRGVSRRPLYDNWLAALGKLNFDAMSRPAQVDYLLLKARIQNQRDREAAPRGSVQDDGSRYLPFEAVITELAATPRGTDKPNATEAVNALNGLKKQIDDAQKSAEEDLKVADAANTNRRTAGTAARSIGRLQASLKEWYDRNENADAKWGETAAEPYKATDQALEAYATVLRGPVEAPAAQRDTSNFPVVPPIGRDELIVQLQGEMIAYTPEELITRAEKEFAWCEAEMKKASRQMGYGDDWKKALEKVKTEHVKEGEQPYLIAFLMREAVDYITKHDMITVPVVASETLRMEMMSPQRQLVNPFFTGGELISVSFPTSTMTTDAKEQSMRGNNIHFARATVFHEMIPGHNFQGFTQGRYNGYRRGFGTPFWGEGWACYWELLLYQQGFPKSPENKIGMLFWRMHRCARIIFSLNYQLGKWPPKQCIDFLVDRVGHERENATAEVRRSFEGGYAPLYQCAYLLGALQLLELHKEMVESGKMTERAFHDAIIRGGSMPIAMVRASLTKQKLTADYKNDWRF